MDSNPREEWSTASTPNIMYATNGHYQTSEFSSSDEEDLSLQTKVHHPKDPRSKAKYNIFSRLFFFWLEPLFFLGARREVGQDDLYAHPKEADSKQLLEKFNRYWESEMKRKRHNQSPRLWVALARCILWRLIFQGLFILFEAGILLLQSVILGRLTEYFSIEEPTESDTRNAYIFALVLVVLSFTVVVMHSHSFLMGQKMSMILRVISTAAIYQKVLSLSQVTIGQLSIGHIINLASNDVQRFDPVFPHFPYLWVSPLHLIAFTYLVYRELGWSAFLASGFILLQVPFQTILARLFVHLRLKSALLTDKRIRIMNEVITGIRVIKMYAWEYAFKRVVSRLRKEESDIIFKGAVIRACNLAYMIVSTSIIMWLVLTVHTNTGGELSTGQVFTTLSLLTALRLSSYFFVLALLGYSEGHVAIHRIQKFLEYDDITSLGLDNTADSPDNSAVNSKVNLVNFFETPKPTPVIDSIVIKVTDMSASWSQSEEKLTLQDINFEVNASIPLLAVIGSVGSGKSTLLQCLLGELNALKGSITVKGTISYISQEAWIFAGTLRENILFGEPYDQIWYDKVIEVCSLDEDIRMLPEGDQTFIGERGVTLSGGQKARVNLARGIYHDADIYLLDDPLSALDVNVAMSIYNNCVRGLLEERLVVLVTHQIQYALQADKILLIKQGHQVIYSSYQELMVQGVDPSHLIGLIQEDEEEEEDNERVKYCYTDDTDSLYSPTTMSMQSFDLNNPGGHITPFSFASIPDGIDSPVNDGVTSVTTPLALFSQSMGKALHSNGTTAAVRSNGHGNGYFFPIMETDEAEINEKEKMADQSHQDLPAEWPFAKTSFPNKAAWPFAGSPLPVADQNVPIQSSETDSSAWAFADQPPSFPATSMKPHTSLISPFPLPSKPKRHKPPRVLPNSPLATQPQLHPHLLQTSRLTQSNCTSSNFPTAVQSGLTVSVFPPTPPPDKNEPKEKPSDLQSKKTAPIVDAISFHQSSTKNEQASLVETHKPSLSNEETHENSPRTSPVIVKKPVADTISFHQLSIKNEQPSLVNTHKLPGVNEWTHENSPRTSPATMKKSVADTILCHQSSTKNELVNAHKPPAINEQIRENSPRTSPATVKKPVADAISFHQSSRINEQASLPETYEPSTANEQTHENSPRTSPAIMIQVASYSPVTTTTPPGESHSNRASPLGLKMSGITSRSASRKGYSPLLDVPSSERPKSKNRSSPSLSRSRLSPSRISAKALRGELDNDGLVTEPGPFDVTSIYSARSRISQSSFMYRMGTNGAADPRSAGHESKIPEETQEKRRVGNVSLKTYYSYFQAGGGIILLAAIMLIFVLGEVGIVVSDWWLSDWANCFDGNSTSNASSDYCYLNNDERIYVYTATTVVAVILNFSRAILFYFICVNASKILHNNMFEAVLHARVLFFDNNPSGKVLNRFAKDIGFLDDLLPYNFCEFLLLFLRCLAIIITAVASNPWLLIPTVIMSTIFLFLRWYYLKSARDIKRLEAIARSPVYSHLSATLQGLSTIRSHGREDIALEQLHQFQNEHSQGWYLYLVMVRWFGLRIDTLSVLFLSAVAFISIPLAAGLNAGLVGLGLTYTISLADMLQYTIRLSADVENTMVSAERVMEYSKLDTEGPMDTVYPDQKPPDKWPSKGEIKMEDIMFQYAPDTPLVLKNLSFSINQSEKIGIVGRTGAGKSSLISVLYRLAEPYGQITIDGVDTKSIGLHDLRKKMSIIPQDPVLFSGTMRYNLDPFDEYSDAKLWEVLELVQLKPAVEEMEGQLSGEVSEGGSNFSVGQKQLVCLARALLRKNKILILDEATANVDPRTDEIIQKTLHDQFANCTVLVIAHRLDTIMDSDKIMFMKNGRLKEFDTPYKLLQNSSSKFYLMVEKTGLTASGRLHQMALESHLRRMFKKSGRITPAQSKSDVRRLSSLFAQSLLQRSSGSGPFGLTRLQERRASILSSNSFPRALNEVGMTGPNMENVNDPQLQSLRLPSDPNLAGEGAQQNEDILL